MMKIIQVTDVHLGRQGERRYGADLHQRLASCIAHINAHHADAALCVFTGDLTETGAPESYADLRAALNTLSVPYRLLPGNHDRRANLVATLPENPVDESGFVQSVHDTGKEVLLFLDCLAEGRIEGEFCERRLAWLEARLDQSAGRPAYIFLHHPPVALGLPQLDPLATSATSSSAMSIATSPAPSPGFRSRRSAACMPASNLRLTGRVKLSSRRRPPTPSSLSTAPMSGWSCMAVIFSSAGRSIQPKPANASQRELRAGRRPSVA